MLLPEEGPNEWPKHGVGILCLYDTFIHLFTAVRFVATCNLVTNDRLHVHLLKDISCETCTVQCHNAFRSQQTFQTLCIAHEKMTQHIDVTEIKIRPSNAFYFRFDDIKKTHDTMRFTCLCSYPWGFLLLLIAQTSSASNFTAAVSRISTKPQWTARLRIARS